MRIILFGDNHSNKYSTQVLINILSDLCKQGYQTIFWEGFAENKDRAADEIREDIENCLDTLSRFPDPDNIPNNWNKLGEKQKMWFKNYTPANQEKSDGDLALSWQCNYKGAIMHYIKHVHAKYKTQIEAKKASVILLNKMKEQHMNLVAIDTGKSDDRYAASRQGDMIKKITDGLTDPNGSFIIFVGSHHLFDHILPNPNPTLFSKSIQVPGIVESLNTFLKSKGYPSSVSYFVKNEIAANITVENWDIDINKSYRT